MINADFRSYNYYKYGTKNAYGEEVVDYTAAAGQIVLAIYLVGQELSGNINYKDASYVGFALTTTAIDETYVINYGGKKLKVLYVFPGRIYKHIALAEI
ncbi:MAG: hypothetical protein KBT27_02150 [Prevotellaceae bacterium]|nr:hypothetical protein [Candidatus Faecinaster equi]